MLLSGRCPAPQSPCTGAQKGGKDGTKKESVLYRPGDVFIVNEGGWLVKSDELSAMILKHDTKKATNDEV